MSDTRQEERAEAMSRRERILEETLRIVGERGYNGFGIKELADRCGLTKPGLLHHFGSKDQLLTAVLHEVDAKHEAELADLFAEELEKTSSPDEIRRMFGRSLRAVIERSLAQPDLIRLRVVLRAESINPEHPAHRYFAVREKAAIDRLAMRAQPFSAHPRSTARQIVALIAGLEEQWLREDGGFDLLAEADRVIETFLV